MTDLYNRDAMLFGGGVMAAAPLVTVLMLRELGLPPFSSAEGVSG